MASGYGISAIGSQLGNLGLGTTGAYTSYDSYMPSMLGMNGMMGMNGSLFGGMNGMGMMGMWNPTFMGQMQQMQQQIEASQLDHASNMHSGLLRNEVTASRTSNAALIEKILTTTDTHYGIDRLCAKVQEGDQDGICAEFDKLRNSILTRYKDEFAVMGTEINQVVAANRIIEELYSQIVSAKRGGAPVTLEADIREHGDGAFMNGFNSTFRTGHHKRYVDETINHCFGTEIDEKASKDRKKMYGSWVGRGASVVETGAYGAGLAMLGTGVTLGIMKGLTPKVAEETAEGTAKASGNWFTKQATKSQNWVHNIKWGKTLKRAGKIGLIVGIAGDILWQCAS